MAWVRLKVAESKLTSIGGAKEEREALTKDAALYKQLEQSRWPMTKLFADVSNATPVGVVVESLSLERDGSQGVLMKGRADTPEVLSTLQKNLAMTGVVSAVQVTSVEADGNGVSFSLQARVTSPRSASRVADDFGKRTLQERIYAGGSAPIAGAVPSEAVKPETMAMDEHEDPVEKPAGASDTGQSGTGSRTTRLNGGARRGETATSGETNKATKPLDVPPPLTDEQIAAMDKGTATKEWAARRAAFQRVSTSPDDKARLEAEVKKLEPKWKGTGS